MYVIQPSVHPSIDKVYSPGCTRNSLCRTGCLWIPRDLLAFAFKVFELKACTTIPRFRITFLIIFAYEEDILHLLYKSRYLELFGKVLFYCGDSNIQLRPFPNLCVAEVDFELLISCSVAVLVFDCLSLCSDSVALAGIWATGKAVKVVCEGTVTPLDHSG